MMKIIDAHNHPDWHGMNLQKFLANMDECGIEKTWLLSWECPKEEVDGSVVKVFGGMLSGEAPVPFERCLSYIERAPERFVLGYAPDPRTPDACGKLLAAHEIYGAKVCGECKWRMMYNNPDCLRLFRTAGKLQMPVVLHWGEDIQYTMEDPRCDWSGGDMDTLEDVLRKCPETVFLSHAPGFWEYFRDGEEPGKAGRVIELLRKYPNLYCDLSANSGLRALSEDAEYTKSFLLEFEERVVYGRDLFHNKHQEFFNGLALPSEVLQKLYHRNAETLTGCTSL